MSFDLFVICPRIDRGVAERFNQLERPGLPAGLSIDADKCTDDSTFWTIDQDGEEWAELHIDRNVSNDHPERPEGVASDWSEIHVPSRGQPMVFHAVAALAEAANGWVYDPQGAAVMVELQAGDDQAGNVQNGYYTPAVARELAEALAAKYTWD